MVSLYTLNHTPTESLFRLMCCSLKFFDGFRYKLLLYVQTCHISQQDSVTGLVLTAACVRQGYGKKNISS